MTTELKKEYDFYIAAPFFNENQITRVELIETLLEKHGFTYFSPRKDSACANIHDEEERKRVFKSNHQGILKSRGMIAITDDKDMGTVWEAGFAFEKIPVIYCAFTLKKDQLFNLMLAESGISVARNKEQLEETLINGKTIKYVGLIE